MDVSIEIKFRAYKKSDKGICLKPMQDQNFKGEFDFDIAGKLAESYSLTQAINSDDVEVMQYPGLKDKNGVEIYEGDIVDTYGLAPRFFAVEFVGCCFELFRGEDGYDSGDYYRGDVAQDWDWGKFEVVGNIYETPELLEDK